MWLTLAAFVHPARAADLEVSEVVVVRRDPLAAWEGSRWVIASEHATSVPLSIDGPAGTIQTYAWQVEATTACDIASRKRVGGIVRCSIEEARVRITTRDLWQRAEDRERVEDALAALEGQLVGQEIRLRVSGPGDLRTMDETDRAGTVLSVLLRTLFDGFHLELDGGFDDGGQWFTTDEPLLLLREGAESFGRTEAVHMGTLYHGHQLVQTVGIAKKTLVAGISRGEDSSVTGRFQGQYDGSDMVIPNVPREIANDVGALHLESVAVMDAELGVVGERVWTVWGVGLHHQTRGHLRRIGLDEQPELGATGQVSPPRKPRPDLPDWVPLDADSP